MKRLLFVLALAGASMGGFAQDATPVLKYSVATNSFWSNWFIQGGVDWNAWYSGQEYKKGYSKSPFKKFRSNPGVSVAIGKWFTPGIGLRTKVQGIWGKNVDADENPNTNEGNGNKYWIANEQVMFNLNNLIGGYDPDRIWSLIPFAGAGFGRSMTHNLYSTVMSLGVQSSWKVADKVNLYLEAGWNRAEGDLDGNRKGGEPGRGWSSHDNNVYAEVGVSYNLGKGTWDKVPDINAINALHQSELDALNSQLNDANAENKRLKKLLEEAENRPVQEPEVKKEFVTTPVSVFFNIGKSKVASQKDLVNVKELANYAKQNNAKLLVEGYADNATGSAQLNEKLSQARCDAVANELTKLGVDKANIITKSHGGVDELSPVSFNRRATVQITE